MFFQGLRPNCADCTSCRRFLKCVSTSPVFKSLVQKSDRTCWLLIALLEVVLAVNLKHCSCHWHSGFEILGAHESGKRAGSGSNANTHESTIVPLQLPSCYVRSGELREVVQMVVSRFHMLELCRRGISVAELADPSKRGFLSLTGKMPLGDCPGEGTSIMHQTENSSKNTSNGQPTSIRDGGFKPVTVATNNSLLSPNVSSPNLNNDQIRHKCLHQTMCDAQEHQMQIEWQWEHLHHVWKVEITF